MAIRVLHVIDHLGFGGAPVYVRDLVENIDRSKVESLVCALRTNPEAVEIDNEVISLQYRRYDPRTILAVARLCKRYRIDVLHAHLHKSIASCLLASLICKLPIVVHEHGGIVRKGATFSVYRLLLRLLRFRATIIIANSQAMAEALVKNAGIDRCSIQVIHNAVDFARFDAEKFSRQGIRKKMRISEADFVLGFVGRLHYVKGVDLLIKALALLLKRPRRYLLIVTGAGGQRRSLEALAQRLGLADRVRFLGPCDNAAEVMCAFDVGVVPSRQEPFGIVVLELMRMRVAVVASGVGGMGELVTDSVTGLITPANSPVEIAKCVERLAEDPALRSRLADAAYGFSEKFGIIEHVRQIERIYSKMTADALAG